MSEPYLGEIRMFAGKYAPQGWALCNGQLLNISENDALFTLLGTTYGGDGTSTFSLPNMQSRIPLHPNSSYHLGTVGGVENVQLTTTQIPSHTHVPYATTALGTQNSPSGMIWATTGTKHFSDGIGQTPVMMNPQTLSSLGGNESHDNMMPSLTVSFIIALEGIYPSQQ